MATLRVGGCVAGGLAFAALIVWSLDRPVPPCPPIATLPLRREPDRPTRAPETQEVWREIQHPIYETGVLTEDLAFTPTAGRKPIRWDGGLRSGPQIWTLEEQRRGLPAGASAPAVFAIPR